VLGPIKLNSTAPALALATENNVASTEIIVRLNNLFVSPLIERGWHRLTRSRVEICPRPNPHAPHQPTTMPPLEAEASCHGFGTPRCD